MNLEKIKEIFLCPISHELMLDPVMASDGFTYDRHSIQQVINTTGMSPITKEYIESKLHDNIVARQTIYSLIEESDIYKKYLEESFRSTVITNEKFCNSFCNNELHPKIMELAINIPLVDIIKNGYASEELIMKIFKKKVKCLDVNKLCENGNNVLSAACEEKMSDVSLFILEYLNIDINYVNNNGDTALMIACKNEMELVALKILDFPNINIDQKNKDGNDAFLITCKPTMHNVIIKLLNFSKNKINIANNFGRTALMNMCEGSNTDGALLLLRQFSDIIDINHVDNNGDTALMIACQYALDTVCMELLKFPQIEINKCNTLNENALIWAFTGVKNNMAMELVIDKILDFPDVNVNIIDKAGYSALTAADHPNISHLLLKILTFSEVNITGHQIDDYYMSPLLSACAFKRESVALEILKHSNVEINLKDSDGRDALSYACEHNLTQVVSKLLSNPNLDINQIDKNGSSALIFACKSADEKIPLMLLKRSDIDVTIINTDGQNAISIACEMNMHLVINEIINRPTININLADGKGNTILMNAVMYNMHLIVDKLLAFPNIDIDYVNNNGEIVEVIAKNNDNAIDIKKLVNVRVMNNMKKLTLC